MLDKPLWIIQAPLPDSGCPQADLCALPFLSREPCPPMHCHRQHRPCSKATGAVRDKCLTSFYDCRGAALRDSCKEKLF